MPGFHPSVAVLRLPFRHSVLPFCCTVAVVPFRSYRCRCTWERNWWKLLSVVAVDGVWTMTRMLIGCPATAKIGFDSICYGTAVTVQRQLERRNGIFHVCNIILSALTEFLRNFRNGNGRTATEGWKPGIICCHTGNQWSCWRNWLVVAEQGTCHIILVIEFCASCQLRLLASLPLSSALL